MGGNWIWYGLCRAVWVGMDMVQSVGLWVGGNWIWCGLCRAVWVLWWCRWIWCGLCRAVWVL